MKIVAHVRSTASANLRSPAQGAGSQDWRLTIATVIGVPRSTAPGWIRSEPKEVVTLDVLNKNELGLQAEVSNARRSDSPMLVVDGGVENFNGEVDELIETGVLRRVLAQTDVTFSNSLFEAFWRSMKHNWLFLNSLDSVAALRRHVSFYIMAHNTEVPHSAFRGQTPDEVYTGTGERVAAELEVAKEKAREERLEANRVMACAGCPGRREVADA